MLTTLASRNIRLCGRVLTSSDLRADEQQESGKENARAPSDSDESQNFHAADAVESRIANDIDSRREAGEQRRSHQAEDHCSRYLDRAVATLSHIVRLNHGEMYHIRGHASTNIVGNPSV